MLGILWNGGCVLPRFFMQKPCPDGGFLALSGENAAHAKVLRLKPGDDVTVCDGQGMDYRCTVLSVLPERVELQIRSVWPSYTEPHLQVTIFMAFPKQDKLEHVIMKAVELGAAAVIAFPSARCVSRPDGPSLSKKLARWQKIAASAAEQSGRGRIPEVSAAPSLKDALRQASERELPLFLYENERDASFRQRVEGTHFSTAAIVTGPEGGFMPEEAGLAREMGLQVCTLGPRILRCETAPLCALTALLYACGEMENKGPDGARRPPAENI